MHATRLGGQASVPPQFEEQVNRMALELLEAELVLPHAKLRQETLEKLSDAVDHVRATLWATLNALADEFSLPDQATALLTSHRVQRMRSLLEALNEEIDAGHIRASTPLVMELCTRLGAVHKRLYFALTGKALRTDQ